MKQNRQPKPTKTTEHTVTVGGRQLIATVEHRDPPDLETFVDALIAMTEPPPKQKAKKDHG